MSFPSLRKAHVVALIVGLAIASPTSASAAGQQLVIPRLGLNVTLASSLTYGPHLYWQDKDTLAIAGHRTTHTHPFLHLPSLRRGDAIRVGAQRYVVRRTAIVRPWQVWVLRHRGLVLSACHPAGSSTYRYIVLAAPVGVTP